MGSNNMKNLITMMIFLISCNLFAQKNKVVLHQIQGIITDEFGERIVDATITINGNGKLYQTISDSNGNYCINAISNGKYIVSVLANYYHSKTDSILLNNENTFLEKHFSLNGKYYVDGVRVSAVQWFSCGYVIPDEEITTNINFSMAPNQNINSIAAYVRGVDSRNGEIPSINGARPENTAYYFDGVRVSGMEENYATFIK